MINSWVKTEEKKLIENLDFLYCIALRPFHYVDYIALNGRILDELELICKYAVMA
jgi:hypothetical protein